VTPRREWQRACAIARNGGTIRPTLANMVAAKRIVDERNGKALALAQLLAFE
jgi:hypothetical protein